MINMNEVKFSKYLSYILRHNPEGLPIDKDGFISITKILEKCKRKYPKINKKLLENLYSEGLTFAEIDKKFLIKLVLNYSVHDIAKKLEIGKDYVYTLNRNVLGFNNLKQARVELSSKEITK